MIEIMRGRWRLRGWKIEGDREEGNREEGIDGERLR